MKTILPELIWIAVIQEHSGLATGVELVTALARAGSGPQTALGRRFFGHVSSFGELDTSEQESAQAKLKRSGQLHLIQESLLPLIVLYPECPLSFLFNDVKCGREEQERHLGWFKALMCNLYDKSLRQTIFVQSTFIWLAFDSGILKVNKELALAQFPEVEHYPDTELSRRVAASIRTSVPVFFGNPHYPQSSNWPHYFWNRGLQIDNCNFEAEQHD